MRFLYRRLGDTDLAEDLAQEAFIRLARENPREERAWLFAVGLNLVRDHARKETRRARHLQVLSAEPVQPAAETDLMRAETAAAVRDALEHLSERDRNLLILREEGLSYREIAQLLGVNATSVGPLLNRAQRRFLRHFSEPGKERDDVSTSA